MTFEQAKLQYEIDGTKFVYDSLVSSLPRSWKQKKNHINWSGDWTVFIFLSFFPFLSFLSLFSFLSHSRGVKHIYQKLIEMKIREFTHKWESKLNEVFSDVVWKGVYCKTYCQQIICVIIAFNIKLSPGLMLHNAHYIEWKCQSLTIAFVAMRLRIILSLNFGSVLSCRFLEIKQRLAHIESHSGSRFGI